MQLNYQLPKNNEQEKVLSKCLKSDKFLKRKTSKRGQRRHLPPIELSIFSGSTVQTIFSYHKKVQLNVSGNLLVIFYKRTSVNGGQSDSTAVMLLPWTRPIQDGDGTGFDFQPNMVPQDSRNFWANNQE